jgi:hypothetical protein
VLFFNASEGNRVSHPVSGGDACLSLAISEPLLRELTPLTLTRDSAMFAFRPQRLRIDARAQALVALLRHSLRQKIAEPLEAESLALTLVRRALGPRTSHAAGASVGRQRLVDRAKLVLASDLARRWTLAESPPKCAAPLFISPRSSNKWKDCPSIAITCACGWRGRWIFFHSMTISLL